MIHWSEHTKQHNLPFNCSNTTQDKTNPRNTPSDEG